MFHFLMAAGLVAAVCYGLPALTQGLSGRTKSAYAEVATGRSASDEVVNKLVATAKEVYQQIERVAQPYSPPGPASTAPAWDPDDRQGRHDVYCCKGGRRPEYQYVIATCLGEGLTRTEQQIYDYYTDLSR